MIVLYIEIMGSRQNMMALVVGGTTAPAQQSLPKPRHTAPGQEPLRTRAWDTPWPPSAQARQEARPCQQEQGQNQPGSSKCMSCLGLLLFIFVGMFGIRCTLCLGCFWLVLVRICGTSTYIGRFSKMVQSPAGAENRRAPVLTLRNARMRLGSVVQCCSFAKYRLAI